MLNVLLLLYSDHNYYAKAASINRVGVSAFASINLKPSWSLCKKSNLVIKSLFLFFQEWITYVYLN